MQQNPWLSSVKRAHAESKHDREKQREKERTRCQHTHTHPHMHNSFFKTPAQSKALTTRSRPPKAARRPAGSPKASPRKRRDASTTAMTKGPPGLVSPRCASMCVTNAQPATPIPLGRALARLVGRATQPAAHTRRRLIATSAGGRKAMPSVAQLCGRVAAKSHRPNMIGRLATTRVDGGKMGDATPPSTAENPN